MQRLSKLVPAMIVALLTLAAALPWGAPVAARLALMLLPLIAIVHFACARGPSVPAPLAFGCGLVLDVLTHGPLGFWAGLNTAARILASPLAPSTEVTPEAGAGEREGGPNMLRRVGSVMLVTAAVGAAGWLIARLGFAAALTAWTSAQAAAGALAVYLVAVGVAAMAARPAGGGAAFAFQRQRSR